MVFQSLTSSQVACCSSKTDTWKGLFKRSAIRDYIQIVGGFKYGVSGCILRETAAVTYGPKEAGDHIVSLNLFFSRETHLWKKILLSNRFERCRRSDIAS